MRIDYEGLMREENKKALLSVIKTAMATLKKNKADKALTNILIKFSSRYPGVVIPEDIITRFPNSVTIALEHQFWGLSVTEENFSVTLEFPLGRERIVVPFKAILGFQDLNANVGISLEGENPVFYENHKILENHHIKSVNGNVITVEFQQAKKETD